MFYDERLQEKRGEISPSCLPIPILVLCHQPFVQFPVIFRKGQPITLAHGLFVHLLHADAAFHASHGRQQTTDFPVTRHIFGRQQILKCTV